MIKSDLGLGSGQIRVISVPRSVISFNRLVLRFSHEYVQLRTDYGIYRSMAELCAL